MRTGDIVMLREDFDHAGFKWTNYRLAKVVSHFNRGAELASYLSYPSAPMLRPARNHVVIQLSTPQTKTKAAEHWNKANHYIDANSTHQLLQTIWGRPIKPAAPEAA